MDKDTLYYHFSNLGLVLVGLLSIQSILGPFTFLIIVFGSIIGFIVSWSIKDSRPQYMDIFIGMLSLAAVVIILGRLYNTAISFDNLLKILSMALAWLTLFQSFGLRSGNSYAMLQFISACLLICSVGLALEQETFYVILLGLFLLIFIFAMRLNLVCEKKRKGSQIIGDQEEVMSLSRQIRVVALMFCFVFIVSALIYPFVPRFGNMSVRWIPSTLLGLPEKVPILKLLSEAKKTIQDDKRIKKEQIVDDGSKKRETAPAQFDEAKLKKKKSQEKKQDEKEKQEKQNEQTERFRAKEFKQDLDIFKIESLEITSDKNEVPLDSSCKLKAELKMNDGSTIPATRLVDWKARGDARVTIDSSGNLAPKEKGEVEISASYLGAFSNDLKISITEPAKPVKKKNWLYYVFLTLLWLLMLLLLYIVIRVYVKSRRLAELKVKNAREFIREIYASLCNAFRSYGSPRLKHIAHREFFQHIKSIISVNPDPMCLMTEGVLEAGFSRHKITAEHSSESLRLFHEVKKVVFEREDGKKFWKKPLFGLLILDVLLVPTK
ncbi:MAG: hypothetical protein KKG21_01155 [Candidatus Omnitrophica bacterium]|nr:hypothetical protein [Candidatus Omnitrophota bacterium]